MISSRIKTNLLRVVIIGRPNVGKSTLFNRLLHKRRAITDSTPGVTRDSLEVECIIKDRVFILVDTGGYTKETGGYSELVSEKSLDAARQADLILFLVDVNEVTGNDLEFIEQIRPFQKRTILVVNKVDNSEREQMAWNMYELGFSHVIQVSALHSKNIPVLEEEILAFIDKNPRTVKVESESIVRLAILGKPNTGKSTLTNHLLGETRSLVSDVPGTTRDVIEGKFRYKGIIYQVLDTAGIRRKKKVKNPIEYYSVNRAIKSIKESDVVFLLIDITEEISEQDKKIASHVVKNGNGIIFVLSKWDLLKPVPNRLQAVKDKVRFLFPALGYVPILPVSVPNNAGIEELLATTLRVWKQLTTQVDTVTLNKLAKSWIEYYPYKTKGKEVKIRYATQKSINPVKFIVFLNRKKGVRREFKNYIKNRIKSDLKMEMIPVDIEFR